MDLVSQVAEWFWHRKLLLVATSILLIELALRYGAPRSWVYSMWTKTFQAVGRVWTIVLLSIIYLLSIGPISLVMRLMGKDLLDRRIDDEATFYRAHEAGPLPPDAAARHQF